MSRAPALLCLFAVIASIVSAAPAQATLRDRVFVASYGSDSNPCTFGSPCKTFQNAYANVAPGGEITAIDSAGFGPLTITMSVTITSPNGVEAGIAVPANENAITVNAGNSDTVVLSGLTLEGAGTAGYGVYINNAGNVEVVNCAIRNYFNGGIYVQPSQNIVLSVTNTVVTDIDGSAIFVNTFGVNGSVVVALNDVTLDDNQNGISIYTYTGGAVEMQISDSRIDNNSNAGIVTQAQSSSVSINVIFKNVTLNQTPTGMFLSGFTNVWLSGVTQGAGAGFPSTTSITFENSGNTVLSDNTSHLMSPLLGGTIGTWTPQ